MVDLHRAIGVSLLLTMSDELFQSVFVVRSQSPIFPRLRVIDPFKVVDVLGVEGCRRNSISIECRVR